MQNNQDILPILWRWRRTIVASTLIAMVLSAIIMLMKPNYYESSALFYPVNESLQKPIVDANDRNISLYGNDHDIDRMLSIAKSTELKKELISSMNLMDHYEIDPEAAKAELKVYKKLSKLYSVQKTQYDAIELTIEDLDPAKAQELCTMALAAIERRSRQISQSARDQMIKNLTAEVSTKKEKLNTLTQEIATLKEKYDIYDTRSQGEALASLESKNPSSSVIQRKIENYTKGVSDVKKLETQQEELSKIVTYDENQLSQLKSSQANTMNAVHVIEQPTLPIEKSRPRRSIYVLGAGILMFLTTAILVLIYSYIETVDWT